MDSCDDYADYYDSDIEYGSDYDNENNEISNEDTEDCRYEILDKTELMEYMNKTIERLSNLIPISSNSLQILLNHFKWDEEELVRTFYDGDQEKLFKNANISNPFKEENIIIADCQVNCLICYELFPVSEMSGLGCEHKFCNDCWSKYLEYKILDEGMEQSITCAAHLCPIVMDHKTCMSLLKNLRAEKVYQTIIVNSFVVTNPNLRWCMGLNCTNAIKYINFAHQKQPVVCKCGAITCFSCGNDWHMPLQCHIFSKWIKKCQDDADTLKWIEENTKDCPNCEVPIEKLGGCNHMKCKSKDCNYEFCWICMGNWKMHKSDFKCNQFNEDETKSVRDGQHISRIELERFVFHYNRYMDHKKSLELEQQLQESVSNKMKILKNSGIPLMDMQFLTKSVNILHHCRTTLMYTYIFAYYLKKNNQSTIFSYNQSDLQNSIEMLSGYLEKNIETENYDDVKQKVKDLQTYCEDRRRVLETHVLDGYKQSLWEYRDCNTN